MAMANKLCKHRQIAQLHMRNLYPKLNFSPVAIKQGNQRRSKSLDSHFDSLKAARTSKVIGMI
jgi:hypothetical protein